MTVRELIKILETCDPSLSVATHANNHEYFSKADKVSHGELRVALCQHYTGMNIIIGNVYHTDLNGSNWFIVRTFRRKRRAARMTTFDHFLAEWRAKIQNGRKAGWSDH